LDIPNRESIREKGSGQRRNCRDRVADEGREGKVDRLVKNGRRRKLLGIEYKDSNQKKRVRRKKVEKEKRYTKQNYEPTG